MEVSENMRKINAMRQYTANRRIARLCGRWEKNWDRHHKHSKDMGRKDRRSVSKGSVTRRI